jgi:hypothetical protein
MRESFEKIGRFDPVRARNRLIKDFETNQTKCYFFWKDDYWLYNNQS